MKILSLSTIPLLPHLGSGKTRLNWTNGLKNLGHEVRVLQPADFELWPRFARAKKYRQAIGILLEVRTLLKRESFDIIEFYGDEFWLLLIWLHRQKSRPLMISHVDGLELHDMEKEQRFWNPRHRLSNWIFRHTHYRFSKTTFQLADRYVCGCEDDLRYVIENKYFQSEHARCISPALDDEFHAVPFCKNKKPIILFLGSWIGRKGVRVIPEVITETLSRFPEYRFDIYGASDSREAILTQFPANLRDRVHVFDKLAKSELLDGILAASILFFPSYSEGFGLATVEAMACGCAVVTTRTGLGSDLIHNEEAILCDFDDTVGMKNALASLIQDENRRLSLAQRGYEKVRTLQWPLQVQKLEIAYAHWLRDWKQTGLEHASK